MPMWSNTARDYARGSGWERRGRRERHGPVAGGAGAGGEQRGGREARETAALAGEVRLVGVAGGEGELREVGGCARLRREREEALEAQYPLQRLRAVAHGVVETAAQLALAETEGGGEPLDRRPRRGRPQRRGAHARVELVRRRQPPDDGGDERGDRRGRRGGALQAGGEAPGGPRPPDVRPVDVQGAQLARRPADGAARGADPEAPTGRPPPRRPRGERPARPPPRGP